MSSLPLPEPHSWHRILLPSLPASSPPQPGNHLENSKLSQPHPAQGPKTTLPWGQPNLKVLQAAVIRGQGSGWGPPLLGLSDWHPLPQAWPQTSPPPAQADPTETPRARVGWAIQAPKLHTTQMSLQVTHQGTAREKVKPVAKPHPLSAGAGVGGCA